VPLEAQDAWGAFGFAACAELREIFRVREDRRSELLQRRINVAEASAIARLARSRKLLAAPRVSLVAARARALPGLRVRSFHPAHRRGAMEQGRMYRVRG
jgi:hypothetical protein